MKNPNDIKDRIRAERNRLEDHQRQLYKALSAVNVQLALLSKFDKIPKKRPAKKSEKKS